MEWNSRELPVRGSLFSMDNIPHSPCMGTLHIPAKGWITRINSVKGEMHKVPDNSDGSSSNLSVVHFSSSAFRLIFTLKMQEQSMDWMLSRETLPGADKVWFLQVFDI